MKRRILSLALTLALVLTLVPMTVAPAIASSSAFSGGTGTKDDPYIITTAEQLAFLAERVNAGDRDPDNEPDPYESGDMAFYPYKAYKLGSDIDLSAYGKNWNDGKGWIPIGALVDRSLNFPGTFDGNGHKITGLYINDPNLRIAGLFGNVGGGTVKNLGVIDVNITALGGDGSGGVGGVVGELAGSWGSWEGVSASTVTNCYTTGTVNGYASVGGIVGAVRGDASFVTDSYSTCDIKGEFTFIGGVVGVVISGSVIDCYSTGAVDGPEAVGGVVGAVRDRGKIMNCYSTGAVSGNLAIGGVAGRLYIHPEFDSEIPAVTNCAALNPSVKGSTDVGRVAGAVDLHGMGEPEDVLSNNRAWSGMTTDGGTAFSAERGHDTINGATTDSNDPADRYSELPEEEPEPEEPEEPEPEEPEEPIEAPNLDAAAGWAHTHINDAYAKGFLPEELQAAYTQNITRGEFVRLAMSWLRYETKMTDDELVAAYAKPGNLDRAFSDTDDPIILAAAWLDITAGVGGGVFGIDGTFDRQQAAVMLVKVHNILGIETDDPSPADFGDMDEAAGWAMDAIHFVGSNGIMNGSGGNFMPEGTFTREQSIIVFNQMG
ncbi:MAG: S-layer homology domain-containing protein [Oscillospiraceae bacterium]|nr:S-layer homology domain-containing protein [Oscillospiraceae bacterium]